jgi:acetyltransferase-like isoleucine patch superfamily enzyme
MKIIYDFYRYIKNKKRAKQDVNKDKDRIEIISGVEVKVGKFTYGTEWVNILKWSDSDLHVEIGRFCSISYGLRIFTGGNHRKDWITTYPFGHVPPTSEFILPVKGHPQCNLPVIIENDVWIGRDVTLMSGVTIGNGAVIAANSHVVRSIPPYAIAGGNPAKIIGYRFDDGLISKLLELQWWNLPDEKIYQSVNILCAPPTEQSIRELGG